MSRNINIIFDGNNLLWRILGVMKVHKLECFKIGSTSIENDSYTLYKKLCESVFSDIRSVRYSSEYANSRIVFCVDFSSFRKDYEVTHSTLFAKKYSKDVTSNVVYKGTRDKSSEIDFDSIYNVYSTFYRLLEEHCNVTILKHYKLEADDLIKLVTNKYDDEKWIIISSDSDLKQLVNDNVLHYAKTKKEITTNISYSHLNESENYINFLKDNSIKISKIDTKEFLFKKFLLGDISDNIECIISKYCEYGKSSKKYGEIKITRFTESHYKKFISIFGDINKYKKFVNIIDFLNDDHLKKIPTIILNVFLSKVEYKYVTDNSLSKIYKQLIFENLKRNIKLMYLHDSLIIEDLNKVKLECNILSEYKCFYNTLQYIEDTVPYKKTQPSQKILRNITYDE